jgi:glutaredoxin 3
MPPTDSSAKNAAYVEDLIKTNKIVVFSKTWCPYCNKAKKLLESLNENYFALELDVIGIFK